MEKLTFKPQGVCSREVTIFHEDGVVVEASVLGGCNGNLKGICSLLKGMKIEEVISRLEGIKCGYKPTSCPDQIAQGLKSLLK